MISKWVCQLPMATIMLCNTQLSEPQWHITINRYGSHVLVVLPVLASLTHFCQLTEAGFGQAAEAIQVCSTCLLPHG